MFMFRNTWWTGICMPRLLDLILNKPSVIYPHQTNRQVVDTLELLYAALQRQYCEFPIIISPGPMGVFRIGESLRWNFLPLVKLWNVSHDKVKLLPIFLRFKGLALTIQRKRFCWINGFTSQAHFPLLGRGLGTCALKDGVANCRNGCATGHRVRVREAQCSSNELRQSNTSNEVCFPLFCATYC